MRFALVTTTIFVPEVLREYRRLGPDVPFIIAGDHKTPHREVQALCEEIGNARYLTPADQRAAHPRLSHAIGWNSIQRRNIAIREAGDLGVDVIVSVDDDNAPTGDYFADLERSFEPYQGTVATGEWANIGELATERYTYRGYPYSLTPQLALSRNGRPHRIGVVNGFIFGDPDINATERIETSPEVRAYRRDEVAIDPCETRAPINSQNTAWRAELAPLMFVLPEVGRYDDIWGSYIAQKVLEATDFHVLFGRPFVRQERNEHDLVKDLEDELHGMRHTDALLGRLDEIEVDAGASVLENLARVLGGLRTLPFDLPHGFFSEWVRAWN